MADKGQKDKDSRKEQKKTQHTLKEKRKLKHEKKGKTPGAPIGIG